MKYNISKFNTKRNLSLLKIFALFFLAATNCFSQINSFPYIQNFKDSNNGGWTLGTSGNSQYWYFTNSCTDGYRSWKFSDLLNTGKASSGSVQSPEFNFRGVSKVLFNFKIDFNLSPNNYIKLQYKIGNGNWQDFTASENSENWYNGNGWSGEKTCLTASSESAAFANQQHVKFRFIANASNITRNDYFSFTAIVITNYSNALDSDSDGIPNKIESENLAASKPVTGISNYDPYSAPRYATDGNKQTLAHTAGYTDKDWIQVDLENTAYINRIKIWNRVDGYRNRLGNVYVIVSEDPFGNNFDPKTDRASTLVYKLPRGETGDPEIIVNARGRYVRLQKSGDNPGGNWLNIGQIEVWKDPDTDNDGTPNYLDYDSDNDQLTDALERGTNTITTVDDLPDTNGNGVKDYLDTGTLTWSLVNIGHGNQSRRLIMKNIYTGSIRITAVPIRARTAPIDLGSHTKNNNAFTHDFESGLVPESSTHGYSIRVEMVSIGVTWRVKTL